MNKTYCRDCSEAVYSVNMGPPKPVLFEVKTRLGYTADTGDIRPVHVIHECRLEEERERHLIVSD